MARTWCWRTVATVVWTAETLAAEPRWSRADTLALPGRCRGDLLGAWGHNVVTRFGADALLRVRKRSGPPHELLAASLTTRDWVPVHAQLVLTEAIVDELFAGDGAALLPLLVEDTRKGLGWITSSLVKTLGPERSLRGAATRAREVLDRGSVTYDYAQHTARIRFSAHPLFAHPTWRLLQLHATSVVLALSNAHGTVTAEDDGDAFVVEATWR